MYENIISPAELEELGRQQGNRIVDCRYNLADTGAGRKAYLESHIPGAVFADVHDHLSGPPVTDHGRHPLPTAERLLQVFAELGINNDTQVVAYDDSFGAFAARLWWLLRYMGHSRVAVLDGGWQAWINHGGDREAGNVDVPRGSFKGQARKDRLVLLDEVEKVRLLVDSREAARYRGEQEPIDPHAGHIPGAQNRCWKDNITENGEFVAAHQLHDEFSKLYQGENPENVVFYCGSGVSACHNLLAAHRAGLPEGRLYAGSWSEWCRDSARPRAKSTEE